MCAIGESRESSRRECCAKKNICCCGGRTEAILERCTVSQREFFNFSLKLFWEKFNNWELHSLINVLMSHAPSANSPQWLSSNFWYLRSDLEAMKRKQLFLPSNSHFLFCKHDLNQIKLFSSQEFFLSGGTFFWRHLEGEKRKSFSYILL